MTDAPQPRSVWRAIIANPFTLWAAFVVVHGIVVALDLVGPSRPMSDVLDAYSYWMQQGFAHDRWVGLELPWVYPVGALLPMIAARLVGGPSFPVAWLAMVCVLDAVAFAAIIGWRRRALDPGAAWWWLAFLLALGPIAFARIDSVTAPLAIAAVVLVEARPAISSLILTVAVWIKVWPAAILLAMAIALRTRVRIIAAAVATSAVIVGVALLLGAGTRVIGFVGSQTTRGLQLEAPVSTVWIWLARFGLVDTTVRFETRIATYEVFGPGVATVAALMTPLLGLVFVLVIVMGVRAVLRRVAAYDLLPALTLAFVSGFILFNKVGSPQYFTWLAAPVVLGIAVRATGRGTRFAVPAALAVGIAGATQLIYPAFYGYLVELDLRAVIVLTVRDLLLVTLFAWSVITVARAPTGGAADGPWIVVPWSR